MDSVEITVPEGSVGEMHVERFEVTGKGLRDLEYALQGRPCKPGTYTKLMEGSRVWMSDTPAERRDHEEVVEMLAWLQAKRFLINGLGLGMVLQAALQLEHIREIDVVEGDERVIKLVSNHYMQQANEKGILLNIIHGDAFEQAKKWPPGTRWDVAWHDIWPEISADNLPEMAKLHRSYGKRVRWQGSWCHAICKQQQRRERHYGL